ncbi:hypothetical protein DFH09DRAFT_1091740 [Mycena vulgaris]|nr:hypothetical protein DFH09DRAFT_1091740 [Mycena vulgaris]
MKSESDPEGDPLAVAHVCTTCLKLTTDKEDLLRDREEVTVAWSAAMDERDEARNERDEARRESSDLRDQRDRARRAHVNALRERDEKEAELEKWQTAVDGARGLIQLAGAHVKN